MLKIILLTGLLAAASATGATAQEFISTQPAVIVEATLPPPPPPPPLAPEPAPFDWGAYQAGADPTEVGYSRPRRIFVNEPVLDMTPEPLPAWALEEPVRYIAETCRPGVRPENEEMEACFTRVEHEVNAAIRANPPRASEPAPRPRPVCRTETTRSQDGSTTSSSYTCTVGDGDPTLLNQLLTGN